MEIKKPAAGLSEAQRWALDGIAQGRGDYAADMCEPSRVSEARNRVKNGGGTLAYIASVQEVNRQALKQMESTASIQASQQKG
jgi:hypothetical protein